MHAHGATSKTKGYTLNKISFILPLQFLNYLVPLLRGKSGCLIILPEIAL